LRNTLLRGPAIDRGNIADEQVFFLVPIFLPSCETLLAENERQRIVKRANGGGVAAKAQSFPGFATECSDLVEGMRK
jgi:hypothetical protein